MVALVHALAGFYGAIAGVVDAFYTGSGDPQATVGVELDAIAAVALGGTSYGGLIQGTIQTLFAFDGRFTHWRAKITIVALLFVSAVAQRAILGSAKARRSLVRGFVHLERSFG